VTTKEPTTEEHRRLSGDQARLGAWRRWGPYVAERSWGTVREDYSADGNAWQFLSHDQARSKAYRWGEDGLAGICDRYQLLCFSLALWNEEDLILKERAFGLVPGEGNHGEDVKEYYFYLDNLPSHAYMRYLYKYPWAAYPYEELVEQNRNLPPTEREYELLDTGVFDGDRYWDVFVEYAKASEEDLVIRIEAFNRGPEPRRLHILPQIWFRNTWAWDGLDRPPPTIARAAGADGAVVLIADDSAGPQLSNLGFSYRLGTRYLYCEEGVTPLFTDNETNCTRLYGREIPSRSRHTKDAFHRRIVHGEIEAVNWDERGSKACLWRTAEVPAGGSTVLRLRLTDGQPRRPLALVDEIVRRRRREADEFYAAIHPPKASADERGIQRQAFASMLWTKQIYLFDTARWLDGDPAYPPPPPGRATIRNAHWRHLNSMRVLSMPDKWEYPWFAAWDLAFHAVVLALVDPALAKEQLWLMLFEQFQHANGQIPAYEWEFSDTNPPVHAWAVWRVYNMDRIRTGVADRTFLERCFHKMLINFAWWVNKVDRSGNNVFEGGFLGLDNITAFDRSEGFGGDAVLEQSDATGWMGMYCLNLMRIALELAKENSVYESMATKFFEHYVYIGAAMKSMHLWDERDGFFYDVLRHRDGTSDVFRVRSMVGLIPLFAVERLEEQWIRPFPEFRFNHDWFLANRQDLVQHCVNTVVQAGEIVRVCTLVDLEQMRRVLIRVCDGDEFLSRYGLRSLSRAHMAQPFSHNGRTVAYEPAEAQTKIKGGNSNWRGPVWFPTSFLMIESLRKLAKAYGQSIEVVPGVTFGEIARELADRHIALFSRGVNGLRPIFPIDSPFQHDPHWRDLLLFHEYFHGDTGQGLGASHQTGWTGLVASLIDEWRH